MTDSQEYLNSLLGKELFLEQFLPQLYALSQDPGFMQIMNRIAHQAQSTHADFAAEKDLAKETFYRQGIYFNFPAYAQIADRVKEQGYAKASAAISTYCVMQMLQQGVDLNGLVGEDKQIPVVASVVPEDDPNLDEDAQRWNEICFLVNRYRSPEATERDFQIEAENIFEKLGWSRYKDEIISQLSIPVGSAQTVRPDLVIQDGKQNVMVIELKKPVKGISSRNVDQLFSYMRLLKVDFGFLFGDVIQLYYDDPETTDAPLPVIEVPFVANSQDGIDLCNIISHDSFSLSRMEEYCLSALRRSSIEAQKAELTDLISSSQGSDLLRQALFQFFCEKYPPTVVDDVLDKVHVEATLGEPKTSRIVPLEVSPTNEPYSAMKVGEIAKNVLGPMLESGAASEDEVQQMQDTAFSKTTFDLNYPLLVRVSAPHDRRRYYATPITIHGFEYKLCSQWFETTSNNDRPYLLRWIQRHEA